MEPKLRFRNYAPRDTSLAERVDLVTNSLAPAPVVALTPLNEDTPVLLIPKKANWDLKRDMAPKFERLESLTQRAIAELVREKFSAVKGAAIPESALGAAPTSTVVAGSSESNTVNLDEVYTGPVDVAILSRGFRGEEEGLEREMSEKLFS